MINHRLSKSSAIRIAMTGTLLIFFVFASIACKSGNSVVSDNSDEKRTTVAQNSTSTTTDTGSVSEAAPAATPAATASPVVGQPSPAATPAEVKKVDEFAPQGEPKGNLMGGSGITVSKAKPAPPPPADPFPPRPTPTIVIKDGKIVQPWQAPAEAAAVVNPYSNKPDAVKLGRMYYNQKCVDCHGKTGQGNGWMSRGLLRQPTNLTSKVVQANTDGELFWKITKGKSPMPAHGVRFDDEQRWYIVTFLRTLTP